MGKISTTITCYREISSYKNTLVILLKAGSKQKYLVFEFNPVRTGFMNFSTTNRKSRTPSIDYSTTYTLDKEELGHVYYISKQINSPILENQGLLKWLDKLGVKPLKPDFSSFPCTWCDERFVQPDQVPTMFKLFSRLLKFDYTFDELLIYNSPICEPCMVEISESDYLTDRELVEIMDLPYYANSKSLREKFYRSARNLYDPHDLESTEFIRVFIDEINFEYAGKELADQQLYLIFADRDNVSSFELQRIRQYGDLILELMHKLPMLEHYYTGVHTMVGTALMNQASYFEKHWIEDLLHILLSKEANELVLSFIKDISAVYPELVVANFDNFNDMSLDSIEFRLILDKISKRFPEIVLPYIPKLLDRFNHINQPYYTAMIFETLSEDHPNVILPYKDQIRQTLRTNRDFDGVEFLENTMEQLDKLK